MRQTATYKPFGAFRSWFRAGLLLCLALPACRDYQHPGFEPGIAGTRPAGQLDNFLKTDSIIGRLEQLPGARPRLDSLLLWADLMKNYNQDAALEYANEADRIATERGWRLSRAISLYYRAMIKEKQQRWGERIEDAIVDAKMSARLLRSSGREDWPVRVNSLIGGLYLKQLRFSRQSEFDSARHYLLQALEMAEQASLPEQNKLALKGEIFHDLGNLAYLEGDSAWDNARSFYQKSLDIYARNGNEPASSRLRVALGILHTQQRQYEKAEEVLRQSEAYAINAQDYNNLVDVYKHLGYLRFKQYRQSADETHFREGMDFFRKRLTLQEENLYETYDLIGQTFQLRTNYPPWNWAYADSAIIYYQMALEEARKEGAVDVMEKMANNITSLCDWRFEQFGKSCSDLLGVSYAAFLNKSYDAIVDTITVSLQAANQRIREFELKEQAAVNQRRVRNTWLTSGIGLVIAGLIFLLILQWQKQKRLQARMEALRAQINPHFISNSLNAIENLVNQGEREAAARYLIHFSRLSRQILNSSRAPSASLAEEIKMLEHFLALEQLRFRDKLNYKIEVSSHLNPELVEMPAMILQPYVENAIWHGIKPKPGPGFLSIRMERNDKELACIIEDDGVGREKAREIQANSILRQHKSQGMAITEERIKALSKVKGSKVEIIDLYDTAGHATGTRVTVRLPFKLLKNKK